MRNIFSLMQSHLGMRILRVTGARASRPHGMGSGQDARAPVKCNFLRDASLLAAISAFLCLTDPVLAEGRVVFDFSNLMPGDPIPEAFEGAHLGVFHDPKIEVLTKDTTPPTPFPDGVHGLLVERENQETTEPRLRLQIKPFAPSISPNVGWIEVEIVVNSASYNGMSLGTGGSSDLTSAVSPSHDGKVILGINLNADRPLEVVSFPEEPRKVMKHALPSPELGVPFRFRVSWDLTGDAAVVQVSINGEVLLDSEGSELVFDMPKNEFQQGIDHISVMLRNAILGRITVSE